MSRCYRLEVETKGIGEENLLDVLTEEFGWEEEYTDEYDGKNRFTGTGTLCGGMGESEAHEQISKRLKELNPEAKVITRWTYLEELPYEEYGDVEE